MALNVLVCRKFPNALLFRNSHISSNLMFGFISKNISNSRSKILRIFRNNLFKKQQHILFPSVQITRRNISSNVNMVNFSLFIL